MKQLLAKLVEGQHLTTPEADDLFEQVMTGQASAAQIASALSLIQLRGPTVEELVAGASAMRRHVVPVEVPEGLTVIDTCGTGGTHSQFFNISTSAAIVAAAAGRPNGLAVAKHGNQSVTSMSGSANVLSELGVAVPVDGAVLTQCLQEIGLCFCFAPAHHPAMRFAGPVRADLGFRTLFNLIGPLTNPAGAQRQLIGVPNVRIARLLASVLKRLGTHEAMVVTTTLPGGQTLGEMTNCAPVTIEHLRASHIDQLDLDATDLGLPLAVPDSVYVKSPADSAKLIRRVLSGAHGPARDIVLLNAAAALRIGGMALDWQDGLDRAADAIDSGQAQKTLDTLVEMTQAAAKQAGEGDQAGGA